MQRWGGPLDVPDDWGRSVVTIGVFDGVHRGHQRIVARAVESAAELGLPVVVVTFDPHPDEVVRPGTHPPLLCTARREWELLAGLGVDAVLVIPFTLEFSRLGPDEFVRAVLVDRLHAARVVVGDNFRFGHKQAGDVKFLRELGMRDGFDVIVHQPVVMDGEIVSSTLIRKYVSEGEVTRAARMLGRAFALTGEVVAGTGTGRKFTFPTLNLRAEQELLPAKGVYITRTVLEGEPSSHRSVTNVGMRPTFNGTGLTVETHLLDYSGNFSPKRIEVRFWKKLREEKKFAGPEELRAQIAKDIARANLFFARLRKARTRGMVVRGE